MKSCFGGHHVNAESKIWSDTAPKFCGDICDIDGYLSIDVTIRRWEDDFEEKVEEIQACLTNIFPRITSWREAPLDEIFNA